MPVVKYVCPTCKNSSRLEFVGQIDSPQEVAYMLCGCSCSCTIGPRTRRTLVQGNTRHTAGLADDIFLLLTERVRSCSFLKGKPLRALIIALVGLGSCCWCRFSAKVAVHGLDVHTSLLLVVLCVSGFCGNSHHEPCVLFQGGGCRCFLHMQVHMRALCGGKR